MWEPQIGPFVEAGYRAVRCDLRGFGESPPVPGPASDVADAVGVLDRLGIGEAAVVGASYGGQVALDLALAHPERVRALVLAGSALGGWQWSEELRRFGAREEELLEAGDVEGAVELNVQTWVGGAAPEVQERVREMQRRAFELQLAAPDEAEPVEPLEPPGPPASERLGEIGCPVLVLAGANDRADILAIADRLSAEIPAAREHLLGGAEHLPSLEHPQHFNEVVLDFLHAA